MAGPYSRPVLRIYFKRPHSLSLVGQTSTRKLKYIFRDFIDKISFLALYFSEKASLVNQGLIKSLFAAAIKKIRSYFQILFGPSFVFNFRIRMPCICSAVGTN